MSDYTVIWCPTCKEKHEPPVCKKPVGKFRRNDDAMYDHSEISNSDYMALGMWDCVDDGQGRRDNMG